MTYKELCLCAQALATLPDKFKNDETQFAIYDGMIVLAKANFPVYFYKDNKWHEMMVIGSLG